tara:strand:- start:1031 stop:1237 length:207 start_codon:yes stop_codon:yes gene_type:complete
VTPKNHPQRNISEKTRLAFDVNLKILKSIDIVSGLRKLNHMTRIKTQTIAIIPMNLTIMILLIHCFFW